MNDDSVIIVGGGVAGLAMANALSAQGIPSVVIEKRKSPGEIDRGDVIHQSVIALLEKWQILDLFSTYSPSRFTKFQILNNDGEEIFAFDVSKDLDSRIQFTVLRHPEIERMLEEAAVRSKLTKVYRNVSCVDLICEQGRVAGVATSAGEFRSRLTVIANGGKSDIRDRHFGRRDYYQYPVSFYNARFNLVPEFSRRGIYVIGPRGIMIMVHLPNDQLRIGLQFSHLNAEKLSQQNLRAVIGQRLSTFPIQKLEFIDAHVYAVSKSLCNRLWIPGAALIGDAAHTTHPVGGQGMNLAFQDADLLSKHIAESGFVPETLDNALARYDRIRRRQVSDVLLRTHTMGLLSICDFWPYVIVRENALRLVNQLPAFKKEIFRRVVEVR